MSIRHFALSSQENETIVPFLKRFADHIGSEVTMTEDVQNVIINLPKPDLSEDQITGAAYFNGKRSATNFSMKQHKLSVRAGNSATALINACTELSLWAKNNPKAEIYDVSLSFNIFEQLHVITVNIYHS
jgi:triacylglycerol esterase/lipase EstA (alpha/beta hydrolase family)